MPPVYNILPGLEVPIATLGKNLAALWTTLADKGDPAPPPADAKAMQFNLVVQLGFNTSPQDALEQFGTLARFSESYPCRIIIATPIPDDTPVPEMRAKIHGICHLGKTPGDTRCCEFVIIAYPPEAHPFIETQITNILINDLPLYYLLHRFACPVRINDFQHLLKNSRRVILDSAEISREAMTHPWPNPAAIHDLAHARTLPLRQQIGQFLSAYPPATLVNTLREITLRNHPAHGSEACALLGWLTDRLQKCGAPAGLPLHTESTPESPSLDLRLHYANNQHFHYTADFRKNTSRIEAAYNNTATTLPGTATLLPPSEALAEALFD